ncbi:MAG: iron ABC transporter permease [Chitinophagales bacterium]
MLKQKTIVLFLLLCLSLSMLVSAGLGAVSISPAQVVSILANNISPEMEWKEFSNVQESVFLKIRSPRILMSALVGTALAISGAAMQGLFRNPLADPSIIGISAGASLAAATVIVLFPTLAISSAAIAGLSVLSLATFLGALLASILIFRLARENKRTNVATMLLGGIAINALAMAFTGLLTFIADDASLRTLTFWTLGSLGGANWLNTGIVAFATFVSLLFLSRHFKAFNALALGETEATHLGIPIERLKIEVILFTSLAVGCSVAFCGMIGFIGLVAPHVLRLLGGADHRYLLPASALGGAVLLCWGDTLARTIAMPTEIPVGIITAITGAPLFLYLLVRKKREVFL